MSKEKSPLFQRSIAIIKAIPEGKVLTYSGVANLISAPGCARHVSYILSSSSKKYNLPWHRVISSSGKISSHGSEIRQVRLLKKEGIELDGKKIDLEAYAWQPTGKAIKKLLRGIPEHVSIFLREKEK